MPYDSHADHHPLCTSPCVCAVSRSLWLAWWVVDSPIGAACEFEFCEIGTKRRKFFIDVCLAKSANSQLTHRSTHPVLEARTAPEARCRPLPHTANKHKACFQ